VPRFDDIDKLREQAARCVRMAKGCADAPVAESLLGLAAEYLARAARLAGSPEAEQEWQKLQPPSGK
jgi:hypothetical protein